MKPLSLPHARRRRRRLEIALAAALVVSVCVNVWAFTREPDQGVSPTASSPAKPAAQPTSTPSVGSPVPRKPVAASPTAATAPCSAAVDACREVRSRYRAMEREHATPDSFDTLPPNPTLEKNVRPALERLFSGSAADHDLECRGPLCRLEVVMGAEYEAAGEDPNDLTLPLQGTGALDGYICGFGSGGGRPTTDPVAREGVTARTLFLRACEEPPLQSAAWLQRLQAEAKRAGIVRQCQARFPNDAAMWVSLQLGAPDSEERLQLNGLGNQSQELVACMLEGLRAIAARVDLPEPSAPATAWMRIYPP